MRRFLIINLLFLFVFSSAQAIEDEQLKDTCDVDVWDVMKVRAELEADREMRVAHALILKPDSVLEYSCFLREFNRVRWNSAAMLSANDLPPVFRTRWWYPNDRFQPVIGSPFGPEPFDEGIKFDSPDNPVKYPGIDHYINNVEHVILESYANYINNNFSHNHYGGVYGRAGGPNKVPDSINPGAPLENCNVMEQVWNFARCDLYYQTIGYPTLPEFADFMRDDWEDWAKGSCSPPPNWDDRIAVANPPAGTSGGADVVNTYLGELKEESCGVPIPTGYEVKVGDVKRPDGVCATPGCYFDARSGSCKK